MRTGLCEPGLNDLQNGHENGCEPLLSAPASWREAPTGTLNRLDPAENQDPAPLHPQAPNGINHLG